MKQKEFERELGQRLRENKKLAERPFLPGSFGLVAAVVGTHVFYMMLILSWAMAVVTTYVFVDQVKWMNAMLLFLKK